MGFFVNPFKGNDANEFPDVIIPLADGTPTKKSEAGVDPGLQEKGVSPPTGEYSPLTLESLRSEVEADMVASGHDTAYDRTSRIVA